MSKSSKPLVVVAAAVLFLAAGIWFLSHRPAQLAPSDAVLPGNEVNVALGRNAVIVEGDVADPIGIVRVRTGQTDVPLESFWRKPDGSGVVAFCEIGTEPVQVQVHTRCRNTEYTLPPSSFRSGVLLSAVDLDLPQDVQFEGVPDTALAFSPDGRRLAIGSASGQLKVVSTPGGAPATAADAAAPGEFTQAIREGAAKALAFAADGAVLVVGEQSPDGFVYGLEAKDGKELWRFRLADELGTSRPTANDYLSLYQFPGAARVMALPDGDVLVLGRHSWRPDAQTRKAQSRLYRLNARTGDVRWRYPAGAPEERNITWADASRDGRRLACVLSIPGAGQTGVAEAPLEMVALDGQTGAATGQLTFAPLKPHFTSTLSWQALALRPDGAGGILGADDGRVWGLAFDPAGKPSVRWQVDLGTPIQAGGLMVHCGIGWTLATAQAYVAEVDKNWEKFGAATRTGRPVDIHPEACSIHAFDPQAETPQRLWRYQVPCRPQGLWLSPDGRWLGFAYEQPEGTDAQGKPTPPDYGVLMFDLQIPGSGTQKLHYRVSSEGPLGFAACFSPDGRFLAVTEGPRPGTDRLSGTRTYRILILH